MQAPRPAVTVGEAPGLTCRPVPKLGAGVTTLRPLVSYTLVLHDAYLDCLDRNGRLLERATAVPGTPAKK
jgi:hypothetical protein